MCLFGMDDFHGFQYGFVGGIDDGIEAVFFVYISANQCFEPKTKLFLAIGIQGRCLVSFCLVKLYKLLDSGIGDGHFGYEILCSRILS